METTTVNIRSSDYDVYIGRGGHGLEGYFGNPFSVTERGGRTEAIRLYRDYFSKKLERDSEFAKRVEGLRGKRLGCFCAPLKCHGDIIAEYLNNGRPKLDSPADPE